MGKKLFFDAKQGIEYAEYFLTDGQVFCSRKKWKRKDIRDWKINLVHVDVTWSRKRHAQMQWKRENRSTSKRRWTKRKLIFSTDSFRLKVSTEEEKKGVTERMRSQQTWRVNYELYIVILLFTFSAIMTKIVRFLYWIYTHTYVLYLMKLFFSYFCYTTATTRTSTTF